MTDHENNSATTETGGNSKGYTPKKGRPTPKRREQELANGVRHEIMEAPLTAKEARARRKALKESMSKEEFKALKKQEREKERERQRKAREAMDRGDERYLLERDKGPVKAYIRDWVDARRALNNLVMPAALVMLVVMWSVNRLPDIAAVVTPIIMILMLIFLAEGVWIGRRANRAVKAKFPHTDEKIGFSTGFYAYSRASQPRRWRTPRPTVEIGAEV